MFLRDVGDGADMAVARLPCDFYEFRIPNDEGNPKSESPIPKSGRVSIEARGNEYWGAGFSPLQRPQREDAGNARPVFAWHSGAAWTPRSAFDAVPSPVCARLNSSRGLAF